MITAITCLVTAIFGFFIAIIYKNRKFDDTISRLKEEEFENKRKEFHEEVLRTDIDELVDRSNRKWAARKTPKDE